jgi:very-short-patch-repair endonuclease
MTVSKISYKNLSDSNKKTLLEKLYIDQQKSFADIADMCDTYANKIRRDAKKLGLPIRDKSEAQKNALITGKHKHPTKGKQRDQKTKEKIGLSVMESWDNLSENELTDRKNKARAAWESLSEDEKSEILSKANQAVRSASKTGSKLEKFLLEKLIKNGYKVDFHKEQFLVNTKLQIDLFLPTMNVAIEVDGPSHFEPVWGDDSLKKNIKYDNKKTGLILGKGLVLIRIKQTRDFSKSRGQLIYTKLAEHLQNIKNKFPDIDKRTIEIGDTDG